MKIARSLLSALALIATCGIAQASVVNFSNTTGNGTVATTFADGTFSHNLSGSVTDGFYVYGGGGATRATNYYGYNNEFILFSSAVTLNSLTLANLYTGSMGPTTITVSLYDSLNALLTSQTLSSPTTSFQALTFYTANTSKVMFSWTGGSNVYGQGFNSAWYLVDNVTYGANTAVPEPLTLAMVGLGLIGVVASRRKQTV